MFMVTLCINNAQLLWDECSNSQSSLPRCENNVVVMNCNRDNGTFYSTVGLSVVYVKKLLKSQLQKQTRHFIQMSGEGYLLEFFYFAPDVTNVGFRPLSPITTLRDDFVRA